MPDIKLHLGCIKTLLPLNSKIQLQMRNFEKILHKQEIQMSKNSEKTCSTPICHRKLKFQQPTNTCPLE